MCSKFLMHLKNRQLLLWWQVHNSKSYSHNSKYQLNAIKPLLSLGHKSLFFYKWTTINKMEFCPNPTGDFTHVQLKGYQRNRSLIHKFYLLWSKFLFPAVILSQVQCRMCKMFKKEMAKREWLIKELKQYFFTWNSNRMYY